MTDDDYEPPKEIIGKTISSIVVNEGNLDEIVFTDGSRLGITWGYGAVLYKFTEK